MTIQSFRDDNTEGYTQADLDLLNEEWTEICEELHLEEHTDKYTEVEKHFADAVSRRTTQTARDRDWRESLFLAKADDACQCTGPTEDGTGVCHCCHKQKR